MSLSTCFIPPCYGVRRSLLNPKTPELEHPLAIILNNLCFTDEETEAGTTQLNSGQVRTSQDSKAQLTTLSKVLFASNSLLLFSLLLS